MLGPTLLLSSESPRRTGDPEGGLPCPGPPGKLASGISAVAGYPALSRPRSACLPSRVVATSCSLCWGGVVSAPLEGSHYFVSRTFQLVRPLPEPERKPLLSGLRAHGLLAAWAERDGEFYLCPRGLIIVHCEPHAGWQSHRARFTSPKCCLTSWVVWGPGLHLSGPQFSRLSDGTLRAPAPGVKRRRSRNARGPGLASGGSRGPPGGRVPFLTLISVQTTEPWKAEELP